MLNINTLGIPYNQLDTEEMRYNCPECDDKNYHLYVNTTKRVYICHKCGAKGKLVSVTADVAQYDSTIKQVSPKEKNEKEKIIDAHTGYRVKNLPANLVISRGSVAYDYLSARSVTELEIDIYGIRGCTDKEGPYKHCVVFPIYTGGKLDYFVCRRFTSEKPKYINAPWPKGAAMFYCDGDVVYPVVLVEGIFDAMAVARQGYRAVALLGKVPTNDQIYRLSQLKRVIIYLDHDAFTQAIELQLKLQALGLKTSLVRDNRLDAAATKPNDLKHILDYHASII